MLKRFSTLILYISSFLLLFGQPVFAESSSSLNKNSFAEANEDDFLPPDQAFKLNVEAASSDTLKAQFTVVPGYYLYKERIKFEIKDKNQGNISAVDLPTGETKVDPNFGKQEVYHHDFSANVKLANATKEIVLDATYQGCSEKGLCYAPQHKTFNLSLENSSTAPTGNTGAAVGASSNDDQATSLLKGGN